MRTGKIMIKSKPRNMLAVQLVDVIERWFARVNSEQTRFSAEAEVTSLLCSNGLENHLGVQVRNGVSSHGALSLEFLPKTEHGMTVGTELLNAISAKNRFDANA